MRELNFLPEDLEDLVRTIETSFGITFTEQEMCDAKTIGGLAHCVSQKMIGPRSSQCWSALVFYRLRKTFITAFSIPRTAIKPDTPLGTLMPWLARRKRWQEVQDTLQIELPHLLYPLWLIAASVAITAVVFWAGWSWLASLTAAPAASTPRTFPLNTNPGNASLIWTVAWRSVPQAVGYGSMEAPRAVHRPQQTTQQSSLFE